MPSPPMIRRPLRGSWAAADQAGRPTVTFPTPTTPVATCPKAKIPVANCPKAMNPFASSPASKTFIGGECRQ